MSKRTAPTPADDRNAEALPWSAPVRRVVSVVLAFHVAAVFIAPWSNPPPASQLSMTVAGAIRPYLDALNINNGYRFFAPDPGPSHIVRYRLYLRDGSIEQGQFPNLEEQWPRLLYHRHLMLAERVNGFLRDPPFLPKQTPGYSEMTPRQQERLIKDFQAQGRAYNESRGPLKALVEPIAQRLMLDHDAEAIDLWSVQHDLATPPEAISGPPLNDQSYYVERFVGTFRRQ